MLWFKTHEWEKHSQCAGTKTVDTYFQTICALAATPVQIMTEYRRQHHNRTAPNNDDHIMEAIAIILKSAGYPVYSIDTQNMQIMLRCVPMLIRIRRRRRAGSLPMCRNSRRYAVIVVVLIKVTVVVVVVVTATTTATAENRCEM